MTNEEIAAQIEALVEERRAAAQKGKDDRLEEIDAQLRVLGEGGKPQAKRAEKRPGGKGAESR